MTENDAPWLPRTGCDVVSVGMDHVRLSYLYLDDGDVDGFCSLFAERAVLRRPGARPVTGRVELERVEGRTTRCTRHQVYEVFGAGRRVVALGRYCQAQGDPDAEVDFVDVFTVADDGLLADRTTFLFVPTGPGTGHDSDAKPRR